MFLIVLPLLALFPVTCLGENIKPLTGEAVEVEAPSSQKKNTELPELISKVVKVSAQIRQLNSDQLALEESIRQIKRQEQERIAAIKKKETQLNNFVHHIRHLTKYSPTFAMFSTTSLKDYIHTSIALKHVFPKIQAEFKELKEELIQLGHNRNQLLHKSSILKETRSTLEDKHREMNILLEQRMRLEEPSSDLVFTNTLRTDNTISFQDLPMPAEGIITQQTSSASTPNRHSLYISTIPGAAVKSPVSGKVLMAKPHSKFGGTVLIQADHYFVVLAGLKTLNCMVGQSVQAGSSLGRMPLKEAPNLFYEIRKDLMGGGTPHRSS